MKLSPIHFSNRRALQRRAIAEVSKAVKRGILSRLDGLILCTDCGQVATEYDHRDYRYPLQVDPVCHGCNLARRKAVPKHTWGMIGVEVITVALPSSHRQQLEAIAQQMYYSLAALLRLIVKQYLDTKGHF